jgi:hypothetical protein
LLASVVRARVHEFVHGESKHRRRRRRSRTRKWVVRAGGRPMKSKSRIAVAAAAAAARREGVLEELLLRPFGVEGAALLGVANLLVRLLDPLEGVLPALSFRVGQVQGLVGVRQQAPGPVRLLDLVVAAVRRHVQDFVGIKNVDAAAAASAAVADCVHGKKKEESERPGADQDAQQREEARTDRPHLSLKSSRPLNEDTRRNRRSRRRSRSRRRQGRGASPTVFDFRRQQTASLENSRATARFVTQRHEESF